MKKPKSHKIKMTKSVSFKIQISLLIMIPLLVIISYLIFKMECNRLTAERDELIKSQVMSVSFMYDRLSKDTTLSEENRNKIFYSFINNLDFSKNLSGYFFLFDQSGKLLAHRILSSKIGQNLWDLKDSKGKYILRSLAQAALKNPEGGFETLWFKKNKTDKKSYPKICYAKKVGNMILGTGVYADDLRKTALESALKVVGIFFIGLVICILIANYFIRKTLSPLKKMKEIAKFVEKGDLTHKLDIKKVDEIAEIGVFFNEILLQFKVLIQQIMKSNEVLSLSIQDLTVSTQEISSTSTQQAAAVKEIVSTMEDSSLLARQIAQTILEVSEIAEDTSRHVNDGVVSIQKSMDKMNQIKTKNGETITGIRSLGDKIESIWEVVNIINTIADQTKIIAFNAALEAASAGDAGKNFQIVASEIRRLADNTMNSTREIKEKINEIQSSSNNLIVMSEEGTQIISEGWDLSKEIKDIFEGILNSAEISANSAKEISESTSQQANAFEQILLTLKEISGGAESFAASSRQTTLTSKSLKATAADLLKVTSQYKIKKEEKNEPIEDEDKKRKS